VDGYDNIIALGDKKLVEFGNAFKAEIHRRKREANPGNVADFFTAPNYARGQSALIDQ
jgi:hypothetical protein